MRVVIEEVDRIWLEEGVTHIVVSVSGLPYERARRLVDDAEFGMAWMDGDGTVHLCSERWSGALSWLKVIIGGMEGGGV